MQLTSAQIRALLIVALLVVFVVIIMMFANTAGPNPR
jgi:hypothetical protein